MSTFLRVPINRDNGTLYLGVTSNLVQRIWQHKNDFVEGFTKRYGVHTLVWFEGHESMESAIAREKAIKEWSPDESGYDEIV